MLFNGAWRSALTKLETELAGIQSAYLLMRRALDLLPDGVLIIGENRQVLYCNEAFRQLWRIPRQILECGDRAMLDHVLAQLDDSKSFLGLVERLYESPDPSDDELTFKDGRVFNRKSIALDGGDDGYSRIWIFSDVTEAWSARIDALTGLLNRRAYAAELPEFMSNVQNGRVKSFALADLDHFKAYNDQYGHAAGDFVLERVGETLRQICDEYSGKAYRIGGEEFAIASAHDDDTAAVAFHQMIANKIEGFQIRHAGNLPHGVVTISAGLGLFAGEGEAKAIFAAVDRALYRAKKLGRNKLAQAVMSNACIASEVRLEKALTQSQPIRKDSVVLLTGSS